MTVTVGQLIEAQAARLVGREDERAVLHRVLDVDGPLVVFVHGLAGVGKSMLVQAFAVEARDRGATVLRLDCRAIEPTERGFLAALAGATGTDLATATDAAARLERLGEQVVLILDTFEVFRLFDAWLQQRFVTLLSRSRGAAGSISAATPFQAVSGC
jgi:pimeloyl-ACP methyl ester carboxylesterase